MAHTADHVDRVAPAWRPTTRQEAFLRSSAYEALYGGAAGGGKSEALLAGALRWVSVSHFRALILRRTYADLERSLIDRARSFFRAAYPEAEYNETKKVWRFPSGACVFFGHLDHEKDKYAYQSAEFSYIAFDELTHFSESQYTYLLSRARSSRGLPVRIRAATNPGGDGHEWVMRRWAPWLDPTCDVHADPSEPLFYKNDEDGPRWVERGTEGALSRVFIPAKVSDNPYLTNGDPSYIERLRGLDPVTRAQLLDGNWLARPAAGLLFKAAWLERVDAAPSDAVRVRYWDRAATGESDAKRGRDPDYTAGVKLARTRDGLFFVEDVVRFRGRPHEVMARVQLTAALDGRGVAIGIEQDPGSAGVFEADAYVRALAGYNVRKIRPTGDKITRAQPASAQAEAKNFRVVRGAWSQAFLAELEGFPEGAHDDQVDALSGAFAMLAAPPPNLRELERFRRMMPKARWS
ncbi:MAG: phage terminase large subunit [Deltaproteobacteria bacterium]|nr:phage terminase large subunit [Deltaproteobacteria bacterium]